MNTVWIVIGVVAAAAVALWFGIVYAERQVAKSPPYRRIVHRVPAMDGQGGEVITLECQHRLRLTHYKITEVPCEECQHLKKQAEEGQ